MRLSMYEILEKTSKETTKEGMLHVLRSNYNDAFGKVLQYALDPRFEWDLPEGAPPFKECTYPDQHGMLYMETRRLYLFLKGGNPNITNQKREFLFIGLLESIDKGDAKLILAAKEKTLPFANVTKEIIMEAFPGLIEDNGQE